MKFQEPLCRSNSVNGFPLIAKSVRVCIGKQGQVRKTLVDRRRGGRRNESLRNGIRFTAQPARVERAGCDSSQGNMWLQGDGGEKNKCNQCFDLSFLKHFWGPMPI